MKEEIVQILQENDLFRHLDQDALLEVASHCSVLSFHGGDTVVKEGEQSDSVFIIASGINVVKKVKTDGRDTILAYLMKGQTFGEVGVIQGVPRSATVLALSNTEVIKLEADFFMEIMRRYGQIGLQLSKTLANYLTNTNKRLLRGGKRSRLILIFDLHDAPNSNILSRLLASEMHRQSLTSTIYAEWPEASELKVDAEKNGDSDGPYHLMESGLTVLSEPQKLPFGQINNLPLTTDRLLNDFSDVVLYLNEVPPAKIQFMGENLTHLIYLHNGTKSDMHKANMFIRSYQSLLHDREIEYYQIAMGQKPGQISGKNVFEIGENDFLDESYSGFEQVEMSHPLTLFCRKLVDRFERNNRVGIFIPSKYDSGETMDSSAIIDKTMNFMGGCFGGATLEEVKGVWNSEKIGIVGEKIYLVYAYTTAKDLQQYIDQVVAYTRGLKSELRQEAMAMEVNKKLTLI